jgi:hypothetical protein
MPSTSERDLGSLGETDAVLARFRRGGTPPRGPVDSPRVSGDDDNMNSRLTALETRLDTVLPTLATKADIASIESKIVKWVAGIGIATVTVIISVLSFLFSRIDHEPPPQQPPIIINIPGQLSGAATGSVSAEGQLQGPKARE